MALPSTKTVSLRAKDDRNLALDDFGRHIARFPAMPLLLPNSETLSLSQIKMLPFWS
jgi:hypothetical protein